MRIASLITAAVIAALIFSGNVFSGTPINWSVWVAALGSMTTIFALETRPERRATA